MKRISSPNSTLSLINPSQSEQHLSLQPVDEYSHLPSPSPHNNSSASTTTMPTSFEYCVHCNRHVQAFRTEIRSLTTKLKHEEYAREVLSQLNRRNDEELAKLLMEANRIKDETEVAYGDLMEDYEHLLDQ